MKKSQIVQFSTKMGPKPNPDNTGEMNQKMAKLNMLQRKELKISIAGGAVQGSRLSLNLGDQRGTDVDGGGV